MKGIVLLILTIALAACGGAPANSDPAATTTKTTTAERAVEDVTRAQKKAHEMAAEEAKRVEEVDDAMKDQ